MALNIQDHSPVASASMSSLYNISVPSFPAILHEETRSWLYTTAVILLSLLAVEQAVYRYKKRHLPGDTWTIPVIGKFADSMRPTMEGYRKQWDSGALSAVSVFNM
jgi:C-22 sterol desaturase